MEVVGDDSAGRKIIVVSACKLPPVGKETFNHAKLLRLVICYKMTCDNNDLSLYVYY